MRFSIPIGQYLLVAITSLLTHGTFADAPDDDWNQWRGPDRNGMLSTDEWPKTLTEDNLELLWSTDLGPSYSGPIVSSEHIFVTETKDKKHEVVRTLNRRTGEEISSTQWAGSMKVPFFASENGSWIRATPALDEDRLYVAGMRDVLVCLNVKNGDVLWKLDFMEQTGSPLPDFGFVSSPLIHGDFVYVQAGGGLTKLDKKSGKVAWQTMKDGGGMFGSAFSSPVIAAIQNVEQLVVQTRSTLAGVDIENGNVLWSQDIPTFRGMNILTPTVIGDSVFTSAYGGRSFLFDIQLKNGNWNISERWDARHQAYMSSPVVLDGHVFMHLRSQRMVCMDLESGETKWVSPPFGKYWSLVTNGKQILALDEKGELLLIDANPEKFTLIGRIQVAKDSWAHLAVSGNEVFIRDLDQIKSFLWKD